MKNIDLAVKQGEFFSFLGPSGCGKTTLLRMIAGFEKPTNGQILINGNDSTNIPPHKRPVHLVFQNYALFPHLTIKDNVAFALNLRKVPKAEIGKKVDEALQMVRLEHLKDRLPNQLSGGQQQRAALARAIVNNPAVLLLDEPLSALDPQIRESMQDELSLLQKRLGMTFIMVTHDQNEALALSSRIAVFNNGCLEQIGVPSEIFDTPKSLFVAQFIGQTNILNGEVVSYRNDLQAYECKVGSSLVTVASDASDYPVGTKVFIFLKPHEIDVVEHSSALQSLDNVITAQVVNCNFNGATYHVHFKLSDGPDVRAHLQVSKIGVLQSGDKCQLHFSARKCKLLKQ